MESKVDNIYIYLWEEFNTIYIGRTKNPKSRHYQHKHIPTESTYRFSSEHHVEHPKMIIIENDLTIEEGAEREKYWIKYYKETSPYNVLNKSRGGQIGSTPKYSEEERKEHDRVSSRKYYYENKYSKLTYQKNYRESHKDEIKERRKKHNEEKNRIQKKSREIIKKILEIENNTLKELEKKHKAAKKELSIMEAAEKAKEYNKQYYQAHKEYYKEYYSKVDTKKYYESNRERIITKQKKYREAHKEKIKEYNKRYYQTHK